MGKRIISTLKFNMETDLAKLAKDIISQNEYLTLATIDNTGKPWVSIMAYTFDENYNFYFCSLPTSRHSTHIQTNHNVSFSIFDSHQDIGKGVGLQIEGTLVETDERDYPYIEKLYAERKYPHGDMNNDFMEGLKKMLADKTYRFYTLKITHCWMNDPHADTDRRVKIELR